MMTLGNLVSYALVLNCFKVMGKSQIERSFLALRKILGAINDHYFSEIAWPIKAIFYVEPPWEGGHKFIKMEDGCHVHI